jgi:hypothetical protein
MKDRDVSGSLSTLHPPRCPYLIISPSNSEIVAVKETLMVVGRLSFDWLCKVIIV